MKDESSHRIMSIEKRKIEDRRRVPTKPLCRYSFIGGRKKTRRTGEDRNYYVDRYDSHFLLLIASILVLCVMDAYFTLKILQFGGNELNPLMLAFINKAPLFSMVAKYLLTAGSIIFILIHKNFTIFGRLKTHYFIYMVFFIYLILVTYEVYFFFTHIMG